MLNQSVSGWKDSLSVAGLLGKLEKASGVVGDGFEVADEGGAVIVATRNVWHSEGFTGDTTECRWTRAPAGRHRQ